MSSESISTAPAPAPPAAQVIDLKGCWPLPGLIDAHVHLCDLARGSGYRRMIELSPAGRAGTPDEVGNVAALLMGPDGGFITGSDILMDGGVTASYWYGELAPQ